MIKGAHLPNVYLYGVLVKQVDSVKYLGHFLTCELSDDLDIRRQCLRRYFTFFALHVVCLTFVVIFYFVNFTCVMCL